MAERPAPASSVRPRNRRGEGSRLREDLVKAARTLLAGADSEADISIRKVTRAAGVTPQAFYLQFATLDELLFAVYAAEFAELVIALASAAAGADRGEAGLRSLCQAYADFAVARPAQYRLMMTLRGQVHESWDPGKLPGAPVLAMLRDALATAAPGAGGPLTPDAAVIQLWATLHGIVSLRDSRPTFPWPPLSEMVDDAVSSALAAVRPPASGRARPEGNVV
jgi:AcrR family transcriptional regulator